MTRKKISPKTQASVLLKSRRRCCICYGLNRDTAIKRGQIAHLDHDPSNNTENNLAFLCFDHHDQYDSTTRQSKNFMKYEVLQFRDELVTAITSIFSGPVSFGEISTLGIDAISGHYIRDLELESADIQVKRLPDGKYHVNGLALWGKTNEYGPNVGNLDFVAELNGDSLEYIEEHSEEVYRASFKFENGMLTISEENWVGFFGLNACFQGVYHKAT